MTGKLLTQLAALAALIISAFFLVDPMHLAMPDTMHMATLAGVVVLTGILAVFVLAEGGGDEREAAHRAFAGRVAFFTGAFVLIVAITIQTVAHTLDPWLVYALVGMSAAKVLARIVADGTR